MKKEIEETLESCRLSSRPRFYKIGLEEIRQLEKLFWKWHKKIELINSRRLYHRFLIDIWKNLISREQEVLELRFIRKKTFEEVGRELGVSSERIRQI